MQTQPHPGTPNTPPAKPARFNAPYFRADATVLIYLPGSASSTPDARVRVTFYLSNRDDEHRGAKNAAQEVLRRFGGDTAKIDNATYELQIDGYTACDARYVRNPDRDPIEAFTYPAEKDKARLIRQRRVVPDSHRDMCAMYGPKPATTEGAPA